VYIRAEVLYVLAVPFAARIRSNDTIKWHRFHAQTLQTQPNNHFGKGEWEKSSVGSARTKE
jgi:hypothetical protein